MCGWDRGGGDREVLTGINPRTYNVRCNPHRVFYQFFQDHFISVPVVLITVHPSLTPFMENNIRQH